MSHPDRCQPWHPDECEGTPTCPPRCPRFVTPEGRAILVAPVDGSKTEAPSGDDLSLPAPSERFPGALVLDVAPEITDVDLNPVLVSSEDVTAVDLHVELAE